MSEEMFYRIMMVVGLVLCALAGLASIVLVVETAFSFTLAQAIGSGILAAGSVGFGWAGVHFAQRASGHRKVFENAAEREVLTPKQRHELRRARGEVVMRRAMMEINDEQDKLIAKQLNPAEPEAVKPTPTDPVAQWLGTDSAHTRRRNAGEEW